MDDVAFLAYTAGFFDGEGCINITFSRNVKTRYGGSWVLQTAISQKDLLPIFEQWQSRWGGQIQIQQVRKTPSGKPTESQICHWRLTGNLARRFLTDVVPFLQNKKKQAEVAIQFQTGRRRRGWMSRIEFEKQSRQAQILRDMKQLTELADFESDEQRSDSRQMALL